ncbi:hypothetical protein BDZ45DRAFT_734498 [Acephala macrosclerotiorum]|nr:hypothetical protein BDZ45DRAFT_734498 [Acephala macrosclerotiorum]
MSSGNLSSDFPIQEVNFLPVQLHFENSTFVQSQNRSHNLLQEEAPFSTALSKPPNIDWDSFNVWDYDSTTHGEQFIGDLISTTNASISSDQGSPTQQLSPSALNNWVLHHDFIIRQPQATIPPFDQLSFPSFDADLTVAHTLCPTCDLGVIHHRLTSHPITNNTTPCRSKRASTTAPKPKTHHCDRCGRTFARPPDLQRHIDGVHLRIRHHCHEAGCSNNHGRGYCRLEKLRKHVLDVHGHF